MTNGKQPTITLTDVEMVGATEDGIYLEGQIDAKLDGMTASGGRSGIRFIAPALSEDAKQPQDNGRDGASKDWHETGLGKLTLGVIVGLAVAATIIAIRYYFPNFRV